MNNKLTRNNQTNNRPHQVHTFETNFPIEDRLEIFLHGGMT